MAQKARNWRTRLDVERKTTRVLLAEDEEDLREFLAIELSKDGYEVVAVRDGTELLDYLGSVHLQEGSARPVDLIISDIQMPGWTGLQILQGIRTREWAAPIILITGFGTDEVRREAHRLGVTAFFDKPFNVDDLRTAVLNVLPLRTGPPRFSRLGVRA
jgi:two-component system, response regulator, stage 0 sporulation protein F